MANPTILPAFGTGGTSPSAGTIASGYISGQIFEAPEANYLFGQFYAGLNKSANDGIWDWEDPGTSDRVYNTGSKTYHSGKLWESNADANTGTPGVGANWVSVAFDGVAADTITDAARTGAPYASNGIYLGALSAANLLNDYEEGTFTYNFNEAGGGTLITGTGRYTKIGDTVTILVEGATGTTGTTGEVTMALPFAITNTMTHGGILAYSASNGNMLSFYSLDGADFLTFVDTIGSISAANKLIGSDISSATRIYFSFSYKIN